MRRIASPSRREFLQSPLIQGKKLTTERPALKSVQPEAAIGFLHVKALVAFAFFNRTASRIRGPKAIFAKAFFLMV